ncbi:hypothetical protein C8R43DRAFT_969773 [Mycena crocata]|nr:hypothetical protein C8R43DRAFT_969773 [Mycena crocata]
MNMGFLGLIEDVVILLLTEYCDIKSVVALSGTNKYLHRLAFTKDIWMSFVSSLVQRRFIDKRPDSLEFKHFSTEQLVNEVKRALRGPSSWSLPHPNLITPNSISRTSNTIQKAVNRLKKLISQPPPAMPTFPLDESRRIMLHPHISTGPGVLFWENSAKLLPGGEYVLFQNWGKLECWSVFEDRSIWTHMCSMGHATVLDFAGELIEDHGAVILTCQRSWNDPRQNFVEISTLDLKDGISTLAVVCRAPDSAHDGPYTGCVVCGSIVAVNMYDACNLLLINWRTNSCVVLQTNDYSPSSFGSQTALIPDYVLLALGTTKGYHLAASPLTALEKFWAPVDGVTEPSNFIKLEDIPVILADTVSHRVGSDFVHLPDMTLWVYESPIQHGRFRAWLHLKGSSTAALCCYELIVQDDKATWCRLQSIRSTVKYPLGMSYSGYIAGLRVGIVPPIDAAPSRPLKVPGSGDFIHISPYSGSVTYSTAENLVIVYYD